MEMKKTTILLSDADLEKLEELNKYFSSMYNLKFPEFKHNISRTALIQMCINQVHKEIIQNDL